MVVMDSRVKMPGGRHCPRIDTFELKLQIERKIGQQKADKYFNLLRRFLNLKISKPEFNKFCIILLGRENISLHNELIRAIMKNACTSRTPPPKPGKIDASMNIKVPNGSQIGGLESLCREVCPMSPRKGRTPTLRERRIRDRPSPLGPNGKTQQAVCENSTKKVQSVTELLSLGSRPPIEVTSVEEGEEVEQANGSPGIHSRSPVRAPFGVSINGRATKKVLHHGSSSPSLYKETCSYTSILPDTESLKRSLEQKVEKEGLKISDDCTNLLNNALDAYMKRLIKPCLEFAASRSKHKALNQVHHQIAASLLNGIKPTMNAQKPNISFPVSTLDFRAAMELNPTILGEDWGLQLEKLCMHTSDDCMVD